MTFFTALAAWIGLTEAIFSAPFPWFFHIRETIILLLCPIALWKYWKCEWKTRLYTLRRSEVSSEGKTVTVSHISLHKSSATLCIQSQIDCVSMEGWYATCFLLSRQVIQRVSAVDGLSGCHVYYHCNNFTCCISTQLHLMPFPVSWNLFKNFSYKLKPLLKSPPRLTYTVHYHATLCRLSCDP